MTCPARIEQNGICGECGNTLEGRLSIGFGHSNTVKICMNEESDHYRHIVDFFHPACHEKIEDKMRGRQEDGQ